MIFSQREIFNHHLSYHLSGMGAAWCIFCSVKPKRSIPKESAQR
jgi:hypothetical protein